MSISPGTRLFLLLCAGAVTAVFAFVPNDDDADKLAEPVVRSKTESLKSQAEAISIPLEKLKRARDSDKVANLFPQDIWVVPVPPTPPAQVLPPPPAPPPSAPPLPFAYMGKFQNESGKLVVYLSQGDKAYNVTQGDTIDAIYRIDSVEANVVSLTYLPLNIKQTLNIEAKP